MKKIAVVGIVGLPARYGGFETLVENLVKYSSQEIEYSVFCSKKSYSTLNDKHGKAKLYYISFDANGMSSIIYDFVAMIKSCFLKVDVILILGVSGCCFLPLIRFFTKAKIVTNIDGLEWKRDKWSKVAKLFLKLSEKFAVKYSDVVITDNQGITEYVKSEYAIVSNTIAYGGDHALVGMDNSEVLLSNSEKKSYALSLCRIEPENNIALILESFSKSKEHLKFIGNWNSSEYGIGLKNKYSNFENIEIIDPIYNLEKLFILRKNCSYYVHGHSAGGTNPSLVEMMHFGKPILAFDCVFNRYTTENKATYFNSSSDLLSLLDNNDNSSLLKVGKEMKLIAVARYSWSIIARKYEVLF